jgi:hypothetical protein
VEVWHNGSLQGLARRCDLHLNGAFHNRQPSSNYAR